ncbi:MAG: aminotransferase class I/II-fold pyridoxal phosphate-dependent enzyme [Bacteroidia bacterium]
MRRENIYVTATMRPNIFRLVVGLLRIYFRNSWTNRGFEVKKLESHFNNELSNSTILMSNGTLPLVFLIRWLRENYGVGEVITTPFTYIATASAVVWEGMTPVYVDIDPETLSPTLDTLESKISKKTKGILLTQVFGVMWNLSELEQLSSKYGIPVFFDAAHSIGSKYKGKSLLRFGTASSFSLHATKIISATEGGGLSINSLEPNLKERIYQMHNFGHNSKSSKFESVGLNAKMSEFSALFAFLTYIKLKYSINKRRKIYELYKSKLNNNRHLRLFNIPADFDWNYAYCPILFNSEELLEIALQELNKNSVFPRRYFWPSLSDLKFLGGKFDCPIATNISSRIMCLPIYPSLRRKEVIAVAETLNTLGV